MLAKGLSFMWLLNAAAAGLVLQWGENLSKSMPKLQ
jgi:hypothetical protein